MADGLIIIRDGEGSDSKIAFGWDSLWPLFNPDDPMSGTADYAVSSDADAEPNNIGGLQALDDLSTGIIIQLFTDRYRPDEFDAPDGSNDRRGWFGDTFDIDTERGERPLGSLLWLIVERGVLDEHARRLAVYFSYEALQCFVDQKRVQYFNVTCDINSAKGRMELSIAAFDPNEGQQIYVNSFSLIG